MCVTTSDDDTNSNLVIIYHIEVYAYLFFYDIFK